MAEEEARRAAQARWDGLCNRFGKEAAEKIWAKRLWIGAPIAAVEAMFGYPDDTDEKVTKKRTTQTLKYFPTGANRYALRVFIEDDDVTGWEDKR